MAFCNPCVRPTNSSIITYNSRPINSIKKFFRRQFLKKISTLTPSRSPIRNNSHTNTRFQRIKGTNIIQEVNPISECSFKTDSTNNDDTQITLFHRQMKNVPDWARKSQIQLAFINQIYFNEKTPEDIFGSIHIDLAQKMIESIEFHHTEQSVLYSSILPSNFV